MVLTCIYVIYQNPHKNWWQIIWGRYRWNSLYMQYRCNCVFKPQGPINYKLNVSHLDFWQSFTGENRELWDVPKKFSWWTCWFSLFFFPHTLVLRTRFAHPGCAHRHCARFYFYFIFTFIWLFIAHFIEMKDINVWFLIYYAASLIALFINKLKEWNKMRNFLNTTLSKYF